MGKKRVFIVVMLGLSPSSVVAMQRDARHCAQESKKELAQACIDDFTCQLKQGEDCDGSGALFCSCLAGYVDDEPARVIALHDYYEKKLAKHGQEVSCGYNWKYLQARLLAIAVVAHAHCDLDNIKVEGEVLRIFRDGEWC